MSKSLFALPFVALALIAAKPAPAPIAAAPAFNINPPAEIAAEPSNHLKIELSNGGTVEILLRPDLAPNHVRRIQTLTMTGFYNGTIFHRVIPGFMLLVPFRLRDPARKRTERFPVSAMFLRSALAQEAWQRPVPFAGHVLDHR